MAGGRSSRTTIIFLIFFFTIAAALDDDDYYGCSPERCEDPGQKDSFFSYTTCCMDECCNKLRFWVIPAGIASVGFAAGAFFALCFQCRE